MKKYFIALLIAVLPAAGFAAGAGPKLDKANIDLRDTASLQRGARLFVNYCLGCHSASFMRYSRIGRDLELSDEVLKSNLMFTTDKVGETMKVAMDPKQAKEWFGATPPDLTVIARSRASHSGTGADYLYTYLRTYYRDDTKATGWNNLAFPSVGMPHVMWELQGQRVAKFEEVTDPHDPSTVTHVFAGFEQVTPGKLTPQEYDSAVADLVAFLQWMGEPVQKERVRLGVWVLIFLSLFTVIAWRLNAAYWKDVK